MKLNITSSDGLSLSLEVIGLNTLALDETEEERFLTTFRTYLQHVYERGIINFQNVEIRGRFSSGQSGAIVFPIMLFTPGLDPTRNHYRVLKYDQTPRIKQEATRFNSLVSQRKGAGVPYEEIWWVSNPEYPEKSMLGYRDLGANAKGLKEFSAYLGGFLNSKADPALQNNLFTALRDVLETLHDYHYCDSHHRLPVVREFVNRKVSEIFADIFPAEHVIAIDEVIDDKVIINDKQETADYPEWIGFLIGLEAISGRAYKKKYLVKDDAQNRFFRIDVITQNIVSDTEIKKFLNFPIEHRLEHRIRGRVTKSCSLAEYLKTAVESSGLPSGMIDAEKLYEGLNHTLECPYWAFYLHHDLNPGNILIVEQTKGDVQGLLIDYYSFGPGGHLFTDVARLEALTIMESVLSGWKEPFQQRDYATLRDRAQNMEEALFALNPQQSGLSRKERAIVKVAIEIRRISLNWSSREERNIDINLFYRNYLFARYAFLLACHKLSSGIHLAEKKQIALLFADVLRELIEQKFRDLDIAMAFAELNQEVIIPDNVVEMPPKARKILHLQNREAPFIIRVWTERGQKPKSTRNIGTVSKRESGQYTLGETVTAYFQSSTDAYVYMINIGPTGDIAHILPNDYSSDNHVKGGQQYTFPNEDAPFEWILQEPAGTETIKVIATKVPVDIDRFLGTHVSTGRNISTRQRLAESLRPDQWAEASCTLLVQK